MLSIVYITCLKIYILRKWLTWTVQAILKDKLFIRDIFGQVDKLPRRKDAPICSLQYCFCFYIFGLGSSNDLFTIYKMLEKIIEMCCLITISDWTIIGDRKLEWPVSYGQNQNSGMTTWGLSGIAPLLTANYLYFSEHILYLCFN